MSEQPHLGQLGVSPGAEYAERMSQLERAHNNPCRVRVLAVDGDRVHVECINGGFREAWWQIDWLTNPLQWKRVRKGEDG